jgi:hypothetical protein
MAIAGERVNGLSSSGGAMVTVTAGDQLAAYVFQIIKDRVAAAGGDPAAIGLRIS